MQRERFYSCAEERSNPTVGRKKSPKPKRPTYKPRDKKLNTNNRESMIKVRYDYQKIDKMLDKLKSVPEIEKKSKISKNNHKRKRDVESVMSPLEPLIEIDPDSNKNPLEGTKRDENEEKSPEPKKRKNEDINEFQNSNENQEEQHQNQMNEKLRKKRKNKVSESSVWNEDDVIVWDRYLENLNKKSNDKRCIDCGEWYLTSNKGNTKLKCILCKEGEHGCVMRNTNKQSRGDIWMCKECMDTIDTQDLYPINISDEAEENVTFAKRDKEKPVEEKENNPNDSDKKSSRNIGYDFKGLEDGNSSSNEIICKYRNTTIRKIDMESINEPN